MTGDRGWLGARLAELQVAAMTLTRLPAGRIGDPVPGIAAAAWAFPIVGLAVGGLGAIGYAGAAGATLPPALAAIVAIAVAVFATGALHEDGLADVADGFGGGRDRAQKLAIMRDSQVGTYGVLAILTVLATRVISMTTLAEPVAVAGALVALAAASRAAMVAALYVLPPARSDGLGQAAGDAGLTRCLAALGLGLAVLVALVQAWPLAIVAMLAGGALIAWLARRQIGGQTGDVLGSIQQVTEIAGWMALVSWHGAAA